MIKKLLAALLLFTIPAFGQNPTPDDDGIPLPPPGPNPTGWGPPPVQDNNPWCLLKESGHPFGPFCPLPPGVLDQCIQQYQSAMNDIYEWACFSYVSNYWLYKWKLLYAESQLDECSEYNPYEIWTCEVEYNNTATSLADTFNAKVQQIAANVAQVEALHAIAFYACIAAQCLPIPQLPTNISLYGRLNIIEQPIAQMLYLVPLDNTQQTEVLCPCES